MLRPVSSNTLRLTTNYPRRDLNSIMINAYCASGNGVKIKEKLSTTYNKMQSLSVILGRICLGGHFDA